MYSIRDTFKVFGIEYKLKNQKEVSILATEFIPIKYCTDLTPGLHVKFNFCPNNEKQTILNYHDLSSERNYRKIAYFNGEATGKINFVNTQLPTPIVSIFLEDINILVFIPWNKNSFFKIINQHCFISYYEKNEKKYFGPTIIVEDENDNCSTRHEKAIQKLKKYYAGFPNLAVETSPPDILLLLFKDLSGNFIENSRVLVQVIETILL